MVLCWLAFKLEHIPVPVSRRKETHYIQAPPGYFASPCTAVWF